MPAVTLAHLQRLALHLKRPRHLARGQHRERPLLLVGQTAAVGGLREPLLLAVDLVEQGQAVAELADIQPGGEAQIVYAEVGRVGVALDLPGVVARAEEAAVLAGPGERPLNEK